MAFAIKAHISDPRAKAFTLAAQKTMYGGKQIAAGDKVFVFASENEGGSGLIALGVVSSVSAVAKRPGIDRQTPRVSLSIRRTQLAKRPLGRAELKGFTDWNDGQPATELNFKFYRQADEQSRWDLGRSGGISRYIFLSCRSLACCAFRAALRLCANRLLILLVGLNRLAA